VPDARAVNAEPENVFATKCTSSDDVLWLLEATSVDPLTTSVALKLNLCDYRSGESGSTTSTEFVNYLVDALRARCRQLKRIVLLEHDSSSTRAVHLFDLLGFTDLAHHKECELFEPDIAEWQKVDSVGSLPISLPKLVFDVDLLINVPKIKFHGKSAYTGALKNNFGLLKRKWKLPYHPRLCETIVRSNLHLPKQLVVADGLVTLSGRGPSYGSSVRSGIALASFDPVAADAAGAKLLGLPIPLVGHLRMARKAGIGSNEPSIIWRRPEDSIFDRPRFDWLRFVLANAMRRA
jgi:uncharacterized protein (DUF362 family)